MGIFSKHLHIVHLGQELHLFHTSTISYTGGWICGSANSFGIRNSHLNTTFHLIFPPP